MTTPWQEACNQLDSLASPTPYKIARDEDGVLCITDSNGVDVAKVPAILDREIRMANAEFIVKACNAYGGGK